MRSFVPPSCHLPCRRLPLGLLALSITVTYNSSPMAHDPCLGTFTFQWHFPHFSGAVPMWLPIRHHPPCHKHQYQCELFHLPPTVRKYRPRGLIGRPPDLDWSTTHGEKQQTSLHRKNKWFSGCGSLEQSRSMKKLRTPKESIGR
jgi:hypothetical protein